VFVDWFFNRVADMDNRDFSMRRSWMKSLGDLGQATAIRTCGSEAAVALEFQPDEFCQSNLTEIRYVFGCCAQLVSEIVGDLFQPNAMEVYLLMFPLCLREQVDHCLVIWLTAKAVLEVLLEVL
jgi:hypothetical protein